MSVIRIRHISFGAVFGALQQYFAAFPMVGANFALPGEFTFGLFCLTGLLLSTFATLVFIQLYTSLERMQIIIGGLLALFATAALMDAYDETKLYFIYGLFLSMAAIVVVAWFLMSRIKEVIFRTRDFRLTASFAAAVVGALLISFLISPAFFAAEDALRFVRMQLYLVGPAYVFCAIFLVLLARLMAPAQRK